MHWHRSHQQDPFARWLADRHYSRRKVGSSKFAQPGRQAVLYAETAVGRAYWVTVYAGFTRHAWPGTWMCSAFRQEGCVAPASVLIRQAVAATRHVLGEPPAAGMLTFINRAKVRPTKVRGAEVFGWTYLKAGFRPAGETQRGLLAFILLPADMPLAAEPLPGMFGMLA